MNKKSSAVFLILAILSKSLVAQHISLREANYELWQNAWSIYQAPSHMNERALMATAATFTSTIFLLQNDEQVKMFIQQYKTPGTIKAAKYFDKAGQTHYDLAVAALVCAGGVFAKNQRVANGGYDAIQALLLSGAIGMGMKIAFGRERPYQSATSTQWFQNPIKIQKKYYTSFPSGHSLSAFALAGSLAPLFTGKYKWLQIPVYAAATGVALSRVHDNKHWPSDILIGSALGYAVSKVVVKNRQTKFAHETPFTF